jgi:prevent-host-death family protein
MDTVGVRELKAHLSSCLKRVQAGERLTVTDRGRAVAVIAPVDTPPALDWVHAMVREGRARWGGGKPAGLHRRIPSRGKPASRMVLDDRR